MTSHNILIAILLSQFVASFSLGQEIIADDRAFIEILRKHQANGTQRDFAEAFRSKIRQDDDGNLVKEISGEQDLNSTIFFHLDAVPDNYAEFVLASWLEDNLQWGGQGGPYYSPAGRFEHWLRHYVRPADAVDPPSIGNMYYVLEDERSRQEIARVLRESYSEHDLRPEERKERRSQAWGEIVKTVEEAFPHLVEEDKGRRARAAKEPKPRPGQFIVEIRAKSEGSGLLDPLHEEPDTRVNQLIWYLIIVVAFLVVTGLLLHSRIIKSITRR